MPSNDETLTSFVGYFNAHDINNVMAQICDDVPNANPPPNYTAPGVGITDHGPAFWGRADVTTLFTQLFASFPDMQWTQLAGSQRLTATSEIGIRMTVTGTFTNPWFNTASGHVSPPLSQLGHGTGLKLGKFRGGAPGLPAFAFFAFNAGYKIQQLAIYMDRYAMMQSITAAGGWKPDALAYDAPAHAPARCWPGDLRIGEARGRRITITIED
jgi:hypothetical protein